MARQAGTSPDARGGGDLGWFSKGTMPKVFDDTCFSLQTGKLSGVVASPYGYHVFKVLGRRGPRTRKFEDVKAEADGDVVAAGGRVVIDGVVGRDVLAGGPLDELEWAGAGASHELLDLRRGQR